MSGKPHFTEAKRICDILSRLEVLGREINRLECEVSRLGNLRKEHGTLRIELRELLRGMDVDSPGNTGWDERMMALLAMVRQQACGGNP